MSTMPEWATPTRRAQLVRLWKRYGNLCLQGHQVCPELSHYLEATTRVAYRAVEKKVNERLVWVNEPVKLTQVEELDAYGQALRDTRSEWKAQDRSQRVGELDAERGRMHQVTGEAQGRYGSRFDPVARERFLLSRPEWYPRGVGVNPITHKAVAHVRVAGAMFHLFVDVDHVLEGASKNARHKARRYGKSPQSVKDACDAAVADWKRRKRLA